MKDKAPLEGSELEYTGDVSGVDDQPDWLAIAKSAYDSSTDFLNKTHRKQFERNLSNFQSKHPAGSKYHLESYKTRSRLFRPKTRTAVRKNESSLAAAMFSAADVVVAQAEDMDDAAKRQDAAYWHEVLNYRLDKTIPWFLTCVGAYQEAQVYGIVVSKQYWEYEEGERQVVAEMDIQGNPIHRPEKFVIKDRPRCRLIEIENFRFDPACDWTDPINSSPYNIEMIPMYVGDVLDRMEAKDPKTGQPEWKPLSKAEIIAKGKESEQSDDTTRAQRQQQGGEVEADHHVSDFEIVWVHENLIRYAGQDWVYYTLSTNFVLSKPEPLEEVYRHGIRPYAVGISVIEAHKPIPVGTVQLGETLQAEANDVVNQRMDNVKLAMNRRKYVNRKAGFDLAAMLKSTAGGIVLTDNPDQVKEEAVSDVTSSAYQEQNRLDSDFDDIAGVFSQGSVQNNRQLNETVGGMELMSQYANKDTEYGIRVFVETWVEPVLRQLILLEQYYEEDEHIQDIAMKAVLKQEEKIAQQTGQPMPEVQIPLEKPQNVDIRVSVGFGNLSPDQRINKVMNGLKMMASVVPWSMANLDAEEVAKEIFGALGHKNGQRFFKDLTKPQQQGPSEIEIKMKELELKEAELHEKAQHNQAKISIDYELKMADLALRKELTLEQLYANLGLNKEIAGANNLAKLAEVERKERELEFKASTGRDGI